MSPLKLLRSIAGEQKSAIPHIVAKVKEKNSGMNLWITILKYKKRDDHSSFHYKTRFER